MSLFASSVITTVQFDSALPYRHFLTVLQGLFLNAVDLELHLVSHPHSSSSRL